MNMELFNMKLLDDLLDAGENMVGVIQKVITNKMDKERLELLDNQDVCTILKVSKKTLENMRSRGELPYQRIFRKVYYRKSDILEFIENHKRQ